MSTEDLAALLREHETRVSVMGGWHSRNGSGSPRRYGWRCRCEAHSPDPFRVDLTLEEAHAGRFAHTAEVIAQMLTGC